MNRLLAPREGYEVTDQPFISSMGVQWFAIRCLLLLTVHHLWMFGLEAGRWDLPRPLARRWFHPPYPQGPRARIVAYPSPTLCLMKARTPRIIGGIFLLISVIYLAIGPDAGVCSRVESVCCPLDRRNQTLEPARGLIRRSFNNIVVNNKAGYDIWFTPRNAPLQEGSTPWPWPN